MFDRRSAPPHLNGRDMRSWVGFSFSPSPGRSRSMPNLSPACRAIAAAGLVAASTAAFAAPAPAQEEPAVAETAPVATDPYLWMEDVTGDKALGWARQQNARTDAEIDRKSTRLNSSP